MRQRKLIQVFLVASLSLLGTRFAHASCDITAYCCSAKAGNCSQGEACSCSYTCGVGWAVCSCQCITNPHAGTYPNLQASLSLDWGTLGWTLDNASTVTIGDLGNWLQGVINWEVHVDTGVAGQAATGGSWSGTVQEVLQGFAATNGVAVSFDSANKVVTISAP